MRWIRRMTAPTPTSTRPVPPPRKQAKSVLSRWQRGVLKAGLLLAVVLVANTLYLLTNRLADLSGSTIFAVTDQSLPLLYQVLVLAHTGLGLLLVCLAIAFVLWHLAPVWKRRRWRTVVSGAASALVLVGLAVSGLFILTAAATRQYGWVWWLHAGLAAVLPAAYLAHRLLAIRRASGASLRRFAWATGGLTAAFVAAHLALPRGLRLTPEAEAIRSLSSEPLPGSLAFRLDPGRLAGPLFVPVGDVPVESPFFPAAATTTTGGLLPARTLLQEFADRPLPEEDWERHGFIVSARIGAETCARCHPDTTEQWAASAHRFSSFNNPFYEASIDFLRQGGNRESAPILAHMQHAGIKPERLPFVRSQWCSSCHDPALMIPGQMIAEIDRHSAAAQAGLTCLACHNIDAIHNNTGNGAYNQVDEQGDPYLFADHQTGIRAWLHDAALKARPAVHKRQRLKPFHRTSEFCGACHKVSLDVPVNAYRWLRGQNEYDGWHDSGVAHNAARTFYLPPDRRVCQDCHMPLEPAPLGDLAAKNGMVRSHRFIAANNALPFIRGDTDTVQRVEQFLQDKKLRIDVFAIVSPGRDEQPDATVYACDLARPTLEPGRPVRVEVVVRNLDVGHTFPGGTNDSNEGWIELSVFDAHGRELTISGYVDDQGHVDADAHFYRLVMVDHQGQRVFRRDPHNFITPAYVNVIGPGTADVAHYQFTPPPNLAGQSLTVRARLMWRKFDRRFNEFAFETNRKGFAAFDKVPELPIVEIAKSEVTFPIADAAPADAAVAGGATVGAEAHVVVPAIPDQDWQRLNDYGIALLLEGNTRGAMLAFQHLAELFPQRPDGWRNFARAAREEGNLPAAYDALRRVEDLVPGDARSAWVWGQVLAEDGRYAEAAAAYERVLRTFPEDRATWRELAVAYYRDHQFENSLASGAQVLRIDPEDRIAHYYRMLSLKAIGRCAEAEQARLAYEKYQIDESAQEVTRSLRLDSPAENLEAQAIHVHQLQLGTGERPLAIQEAAGVEGTH
jgi:tetratricopeptide (TPR) repeat protein